MKFNLLQYSFKVWRYVWCISLLIFFGSPRLFAQTESDYEEISVFLMVQRVGGIDIPAVYMDEQIFLPVEDVFNFLKIKNIPSPTYDSVSGFFINPDTPYLIDNIRHEIKYGAKVTQLKPKDIIHTENNLYLRSNYFGEIFGLDCTFSFRSLSVVLNTKIELPVIRDMRLEFMRTNIVKMKGETVADTTVPRTHPFFRFGIADWSYNATQEIGGVKQSRYNVGLGGVFAGGEARINLQYSAGESFNEEYQQYLWRLVDNDRTVFRQISAGKIATQATSSLYDPVVGVQVTNAPTTYRRSFGTYTLRDFTEPDWAVELYVNNVLVDFKKADASGFFTFEVPLMYGTTNVLLRYYGTFGEEKSKQEIISIPYNFLPAGELQYTASAGIVEDSLMSKFSKFSTNYGLGKSMAIGAGMEYLSSVSSGSFMPFVNTSMRLGSNILFSGEYTYGVRTKGIMNYRTPKNLQVELTYTLYDRNQKAINFNYLEERKAAISFPVKSGLFSMYNRVSVSQIILPTTDYITTDWLLSGVLFGISTNLTTYAMLGSTPYIYSSLALGIRLPKKLMLRPQIQYEFTGMRFMLAKAEIEKQFSRSGYLTASYDYNFRQSLQNIQFGFRYEFGMAQTSFNYRRSNNFNTFSEAASGSVLFDRRTKHIGVSSRSGIGKGGIVLMPFLDVNENGKFDKGESKVLGLKISLNGGRVEQSQRDSVIRISDLEPYVGYLIELNNFSFDNIAWQMRMKNVRVMVDPNQIKLVEIPITVMGEGSGMVYLRTKLGDIGYGRILVNFYKSDGTFFSKTMTEQGDGYFSFLGLPSGSYIARVDTVQMRNLKQTATPSEIRFTLKGGPDGDYKDGLDFIILKNDEMEAADAGEMKPETENRRPETGEQKKELKTDGVNLKIGGGKTENGDRRPKTGVKAEGIGQKAEVKNEEKGNKEEVKEEVKREEVKKEEVKKEEGAKVEPVKVEPVKVVAPKNPETAKQTMKPEPAVLKDATLFYSIQIGASKTYIEPEFFKNKFNLTDEVFMFKKDGWYKYAIGQFATSREAQTKLTQLGVSGFLTKVDKSLIGVR